VDHHQEKGNSKANDSPASIASTTGFAPPSVRIEGCTPPSDSSAADEDEEEEDEEEDGELFNCEFFSSFHSKYSTIALENTPP